MDVKSMILGLFVGVLGILFVVSLITLIIHVIFKHEEKKAPPTIFVGRYQNCDDGSEGNTDALKYLKLTNSFADNYEQGIIRK